MPLLNSTFTWNTPRLTFQAQDLWHMSHYLSSSLSLSLPSISPHHHIQTQNSSLRLQGVTSPSVPCSSQQGPFGPHHPSANSTYNIACLFSFSSTYKSGQPVLKGPLGDGHTQATLMTRVMGLKMQKHFYCFLESLCSEEKRFTDWAISLEPCLSFVCLSCFVFFWSFAWRFIIIILLSLLLLCV